MTDDFLAPPHVLLAPPPVPDVPLHPRHAVLNMSPFTPLAASLVVPDATRRPLREPLRLVLVALGLGLGADALFRGGEIAFGLNFPIAVVVVLLSLALCAEREGIFPKRRAVALFATPLLFFAAMVAVRASTSLTFYNVSACAILLLLLLHYWVEGDPASGTFSAWPLLPFKVLGGILAAAPGTLSAAGRVSLSGARHARFAAIGRGVLFALPVLFVFTALFINADAVFAQRARDAFALLIPAHVEESSARLAWVAGAAFAFAGGFAYALTRREREAVQRPVAIPIRPLGITEAGIVIGTLIALFGAFLLSQTAYLFGGDALVRVVPGLTYAGYARHGFAELNIAVLLTLVLIGGLKAITGRTTPRQMLLFSALATCLILLTLPLLASAFARMFAYEAAYGATETRLFVDVFMGWVAVGLLWCAATLWGTRPRGDLGVYVCAVGFLVSLNVINPDANIARRNTERFERTGRMDDDYLASLSEDAVPELTRLAPAPGRAARIETLRAGILRRMDDTRYRDWGAWNLSRAVARRDIMACESHNN